LKLQKNQTQTTAQKPACRKPGTDHSTSFGEHRKRAKRVGGDNLPAGYSSRTHKTCWACLRSIFV